MENLTLIAAILGVVEGITEFLPISSTGHMILVGSWLGFEGEQAATFMVFIQLGAILAVVAMYRRRFAEMLRFKADRGFHGRSGVGLLMVATIPALLVGLLLHDWIKEHLFGNGTVAVGLVLGGVWILVAEWFRRGREGTDLDGLTWRQALAIGLFQCLAMWPGVSRSAATILGGLAVGLSRRSATEFSFFAAVPIMFAACLFELVSNISSLSSQFGVALLIGFVTSFVTAWFAIRFLIHFVARHTLVVFGWYRVALALLLFALLFRG